MFDITTPEQFYAMLVEDFDEYMGDLSSTRKALHCTIEAYHLREWIWKGWLKDDAETRKALGIQNCAEFNKWVNEHCVWFPFVRKITNGTKHFGNPEDFETARIGAAPFVFDQRASGFNEGAWDHPILEVSPLNKGCLILDLGEPIFDKAAQPLRDIEPVPELRFLPAAHLLETVVKFWRDFFRVYRPLSNVPSSRYHIY